MIRVGIAPHPPVRKAETLWSNQAKGHHSLTQLQQSGSDVIYCWPILMWGEAQPILHQHGGKEAVFQSLPVLLIKQQNTRTLDLLWCQFESTFVMLRGFFFLASVFPLIESSWMVSFVAELFDMRYLLCSNDTEGEQAQELVWVSVWIHQYDEKYQLRGTDPEGSHDCCTWAAMKGSQHIDKDT